MTLPIAERVGHRMVRELTDNLTNIDIFIEEHGAHSVLRYLLQKWPNACPWTGCSRPHKVDGSHEPDAGVVDAEIAKAPRWTDATCGCGFCREARGAMT